MAKTLRDVMTSNPTTCPTTASITDVAKVMRDENIGAVLVVDGDQVKGIATDRDIVTGALADGRTDATIGDVCTGDVVTLSPDDDVTKAEQLMRQRDVRRLPVVEQGKPVGIVSLGDLAQEGDEGRTLRDISSAAPNN